MAKIKFNIKIKDIDFDSYIILEGQQLYFFNQSSDGEKERWIKSELERKMKISDIKVER